MQAGTEPAELVTEEALTVIAQINRLLLIIMIQLNRRYGNTTLILLVIRDRVNHILVLLCQSDLSNV